MFSNILATASTLCEEAAWDIADRDAIQGLGPELVELLPDIISNSCKGRLSGEPGLAQLIVDDGTCDRDGAQTVLRVWWGGFWAAVVLAAQAGDSDGFDPDFEGRLESAMLFCTTG